MNKIVILALFSIFLFIVQAQIEQTGEPPFNHVLTSGQKGHVVDVHVPTQLNADLKEIGYSFWIKGDYLSPKYFDFGNLHANWPGIAHICDNTFGSCSGAARHRFLALWLTNSAHQGTDPKFHFSSYQTNNGNPWKNMKFPGGREDYDHVWNFISFSYSFVEQKAVAITYFGRSKETSILEWANNAKHQPQLLKFRIGGCNSNNPAVFQGQFHDVNFQYSTSQSGAFIGDVESFHRYRNSRYTPNDSLYAPEINTVLNGAATLRIGQDGQINKWENLNGLEEYAVWGWAKWDYTQQKKAWHLLYRFSGLKESDVQNMSKIGDRTLACWVGNGYLHFSTYNFGWHGGHQVNLPKNINYGEDLTNWFFVYQGYSFTEKKVQVYVKFDGKEETAEWTDIWHMKPDDVTFQLGDDQWHSTFNGDLKNWNVALGKGFRTENFEELYEQTVFKGDDQIDLVEPTEPEAVLIDSEYDDKEVYKFSVPEDELADVQDTTYSFWFRWNHYEPKPVNLGWQRARWLALASLSENDSCNVGVNDRWQSIWLQHFNVGEPRLHFTTYAQNKGNWNYWQNMVFEDPLDFDSSWNFLYYSYSHRTQRLFAYVKFGRSGKVQTLKWDPSAHTNPPGALTFRLGQCQQSNMGFNGQFWNPRFYYKGDSFLGTKEAVDAYYNTSQKPQLFLPPVFKTVNLVNGEKYFEYDTEEPVVVGPIEGVSGAEEYAIYGWAKWEYIPNKSTWHILYRHNNYDPETYTNMNKFGDRDQTCWIGNGYLHTSTFNSALGGGDNWNMPKNSNYEDDLESWFWFYQGYSYKHKKTFFYVKFHDDRVITQTWENNYHQLPSSPYIYLGKDKYHLGFNGYMRDVNAVYGPGAYKETGFAEWQNIQEVEQGFDDDQFWQAEPEVQKSEHTNYEDKSWYEVEVPKEELSGIQEYSFSAYVKQSMADPVRAGLGIPRNNWRGIMGITEKDEFCTHTKHGHRTLSVYDSHWTRAGAPSYHFNTYATNKGNTNMWKDIPYGEDQDVDGSWNWIYFGYSLVEQKAFALVKFGRSGLVKSETWDHIAHAQDIEQLKLIYGNCGSDHKHQGFHGAYYDVRFRWDKMAFKGTEAHALHYLQNSVPTALTTRPAYNLLPLTDGQEKFELNQELGKPLEFPNKYAGAEEYAIYGWSKWTYTKSKTTWHQLFRVQVNEDGKDNSNLGDRTLACWVGNGYLHFSTYNFDLKSKRIVNGWKNVSYGNDLDSWFFVYFGYNWNQRKATAYVKFQDRTETLVWENNRHFIPKFFRIQLGNDQWYKAFNGQMRGWFFNAGKGAYRDGEFEQLYNKKPWSSGNSVQTSQLRPTSEVIVKPAQESLAPEQLIMNEDVLSKIQYYGYWGWTRWSFRAPDNYKVGDFKNKCYSVARAVAVKGQGITTSLCVRPNKTVFYKFCDTYAKTCLEFQVDNAIEEVFDQWVWVYYAHNQVTKENAAYIYFDATSTGKSLTQGSTAQPEPLPRLNYKVGGRQNGENVFNGFIFDDEFQTGEQAWINVDEEGAIEAFRASKADAPADLNGENLSSNSIYIPVKENNEFNVDQNSNPADSSKLVNDYQSVREYAVFGWTKVHGANMLGKTPWITFFRLTINTPENLSNLKTIGDRTLNVWIHKNLSMAYVSYDFNFPANPDLNRHAYTPSFTVEDLTSGFFFTYMAYSPKHNKVYLYIELSDGRKHEFPVEGVEQIAGSHFGLYLGVDFNGTKNYKNLDAKFKFWHIALGNGVYGETEEDMAYFKQVASTEGIIVEEEEVIEDPIEGDGEGVDTNEEDQECIEGQICNEENQVDEEQPSDVVEEEENEDDLVDNTDQVTGDQNEGSENNNNDNNGETDNAEEGDNTQVDQSGQEDAQNCDDIEYVPNDPNEAPAPEGECVILYSECNFKGQWEQICDKSPKVFIDVKSVYIPEGLRIKLFNLPCFEGKTAIFHSTVPCLDSIEFNLLQKAGIKLINSKKSNILGGLRKKNFIKAHILHSNDQE